GERPLPAAEGNGGRESGVPAHRRRARHRCERRREPRRALERGQPHLRHADPERRRVADGRRAEAEHEPGLRGHRQPALPEPEDGNAVRRREGLGREADRRRQGAVAAAVLPFFRAADIEAAVSPERAVEAVRNAFVAYASGEWSMPPKVYVPAYPAGDFRAMPALGAGHALLKWVTSFPGNPAHGLPTVTGVVVLSDASTGMPKALLDAAAVTALRTGAAAVLAAETLARADASGAAVIGAGVNGRAVARAFGAVGREVALWDVDADRARAAADEIGARVAASRDDALAADVVATVTPGKEFVVAEGDLRPGQHVSLMGADGPGKAEIAVGELARVHV